ncbi:TPA: hypothetical protein OCQ31_004918 [Escherichia coli]|uniref:hypothetical protein n=2 Tax=Enterobacterales TaxID=91347 RepID=UPI0003EB113C|nr:MULTISPECIES: hypothetical protein [Enterobacteriaceae]EAA7927977.1 hypothetical protein [Salmonella enterica subsp. enterica serovar Kottbus]ECF7131046.1 hypothetical protein [Salmonella enterica subsp. enterica]EFC8147740.1 hypothetical protein [Escherichia coli O157:H7]EGM3937793.1 hypothetical protein [Shigella flexneri]EIH0663329.1 hypothetical protein [Escherichia coli O158]ELU2237376.1 hypothetical protein [Klebsiella pneumoniae]HBM0838463.1 hypothetical protein [Salmonella enteric
MSNNYDLIAKAIKEKLQVTAYYQGFYREMCPHALGSKKGRKQALFYQFGGESSKGTVTPGSTFNWRCIPIDGLTEVTLQSGQWYTAENHSQAQTCVDQIDIEVQ